MWGWITCVHFLNSIFQSSFNSLLILITEGVGTLWRYSPRFLSNAQYSLDTLRVFTGRPHRPTDEGLERWVRNGVQPVFCFGPHFIGFPSRFIFGPSRLQSPPFFGVALRPVVFVVDHFFNANLQRQFSSQLPRCLDQPAHPLLDWPLYLFGPTTLGGGRLIDIAVFTVFKTSNMPPPPFIGPPVPCEP